MRKINYGGKIVNGRWVPVKRIFDGKVYTEECWSRGRDACEGIGHSMRAYEKKILGYRVIKSKGSSGEDGYALLVRKNPKWRKDR
jgi:hypothetical protein